MNKLFFFVVFSTLLGPQYAFSRGALCYTIFPRPPFVQYGSDFTYVKTETAYEVNVKDYGYYFNAYLSEHGTLTFSVYLHNLDLSLRSHLRGSELFTDMIQHFGKERIKTIVARWSDGTNYDLFFEALAKEGTSPQAAALQTWTGRMAAAHGYNHVGFVEVGKAPFTNDRQVVAAFTRSN